MLLLLGLVVMGVAFVGPRPAQLLRRRMVPPAALTELVAAIQARPVDHDGWRAVGKRGGELDGAQYRVLLEELIAVCEDEAASGGLPAFAVSDFLSSAIEHPGGIPEDIGPRLARALMGDPIVSFSDDVRSGTREQYRVGTSRATASQQLVRVVKRVTAIELDGAPYPLPPDRTDLADVLIDMEPGEHEFVFTVDLGASFRNPHVIRVGRGDGLWDDAEYRWSGRVCVPFVVRAADDWRFDLVLDAPDDEVREHVAISEISVVGGRVRPVVELRRRPPWAIAMDVFLRDGDGVEVATGGFYLSGPHWGSSIQDTAFPGVEAGEVLTIILRPALDRLHGRSEVTDAWAREVIYQNVPVVEGGR